jgi:hypothetical protein
MTRRTFLPTLILALGLPTLAYTLWRTRTLPAPPPSILRPRYRRSRPAQSVKLPRGLYLNGRTRIVHFVDENGRVRGGARIRGELVPIAWPELAAAFQAGEQLPRINIAYGSSVLESLAHELLTANDFDRAARLLRLAIQHDLLRYKRHRREWAAQKEIAPLAADLSPSFRLYDVLAREALRRGKPTHLRWIIATLEREPLQIRRRFADRLAKWTNVSSRWYKNHRALTTR